MKNKTQKRPESESSPAYAGFYPVIAPLIMGQGVGDGKTTACLMAQAATIDALRRGETLDRATDEMECACPVLRRIAIRLNDGPWWGSDRERTDALRPLIPLLLDSKGSRDLTQRRIYFAADWAVRVITPLRFEWIAKHRKGKVAELCLSGAKRLREQGAITDKKSALAARDVAREIHASAYAAAAADAAYAAYAAAADAAYAADAAADAAYADAAYAADADADAADADAAQKKIYRDSCLGMFKACAALK